MSSLHHANKHSFAGTGTVAVVIAWFILPEVARRTPGEIDEMSVDDLLYLSYVVFVWLTTCSTRFEKKVSLRGFKNYVTEVQLNAEHHQDKTQGEA